MTIETAKEAAPETQKPKRRFFSVAFRSFRFFLFFPLLSVLSVQAAASPTVELKVITTSATLATPITLWATADVPANTNVALDPERSASDLYVVSKVEPMTPASKAQGPGKAFQIALLPLAPGRMDVRLFWKVGGESVASPVVTLDVAEPPLKDSRLEDIKPPRRARPPLWPWLVVAALAWLAYRMYQRWARKKSDRAESTLPVDTRPPEVIAEEALQNLERSELWRQGRAREFYFALTDILREYLERRYGVPATRLTSLELYRRLRQSALEAATVSRLKDLLERADLAKFAKFSPLPDAGQRDIQSARDIVRLTTPRPEPVAGVTA